MRRECLSVMSLSLLCSWNAVRASHWYYDGAVGLFRGLCMTTKHPFDAHKQSLFISIGTACAKHHKCLHCDSYKKETRVKEKESLGAKLLKCHHRGKAKATETHNKGRIMSDMLRLVKSQTGQTIARGTSF